MLLPQSLAVRHRQDGRACAPNRMWSRRNWPTVFHSRGSNRNSFPYLAKDGSSASSPDSWPWLRNLHSNGFRDLRWIRERTGCRESLGSTWWCRCSRRHGLRCAKADDLWWLRFAIPVRCRQRGRHCGWCGLR